MNVEIPAGSAYIIVGPDGHVRVEKGDAQTLPDGNAAKAFQAAAALAAYGKDHWPEIWEWFKRDFAAYVAVEDLQNAIKDHK